MHFIALNRWQGEGEARFIVVTKRRERQPQGPNTVGLQPTDDKSWRARNQEEKKKAAAEPTLRIQPVRQPKGPEPLKGFSDVHQCCSSAVTLTPSRRSIGHHASSLLRLLWHLQLRLHL